MLKFFVTGVATHWDCVDRKSGLAKVPELHRVGRPVARGRAQLRGTRWPSVVEAAAIRANAKQVGRALAKVPKLLRVGCVPTQEPDSKVTRRARFALQDCS